MYVSAGITEEEHRVADLAIRKEELELRRRQVDLQRKSRWWTAAAAVATIGIPIATFFGFKAWFGKKRRR